MERITQLLEQLAQEKKNLVQRSEFENNKLAVMDNHIQKSEKAIVKLANLTFPILNQMRDGKQISRYTMTNLRSCVTEVESLLVEMELAYKELAQ